MSHLLIKNEAHDAIASPNILEEDSPEEKSVILAVAYSLILPGMGELYAGTFSTGKYFTVADAGLWLTYGGFITHGNWLRNDARSFAVEHAGVQPEGKDDNFFVDIGDFNNIDDYNQQKLRNRQYEMLYSGPEYKWAWDSEEHREQFRSLRVRSSETFRNSRFVIGAAVLNRIISAFLAGRAVAAHNRRVRYEGAWQLHVYPSSGVLSDHGVELRVSREF